MIPNPQSITVSRLGITIVISWDNSHWNSASLKEIAARLEVWMNRLILSLPKRKSDLGTMWISNADLPEDEL